MMNVKQIGTVKMNAWYSLSSGEFAVVGEL